MRRSRIIMGTGVSLDVPGANELVFKDVFKLLHDIEAKFSTYKHDSELSHFQRGEVSELELSAEMKEVKSACTRYEKLTNGYFSAGYGKVFDPTGYVKGWAIAKAGELIKKSGHKTFCISIGGDVLAASDGSREWGIGIQNPSDKTKILNKLSISNGAVATSGNYERGKHIVNPKNGALADEFASVTVVGPDIITADVLATACFAAGKAWHRIINSHPDYQAIVIDKQA